MKRWSVIAELRAWKPGVWKYNRRLYQWEHESGLKVYPYCEPYGPISDDFIDVYYTHDGKGEMQRVPISRELLKLRMRKRKHARTREELHPG